MAREAPEKARCLSRLIRVRNVDAVAFARGRAQSMMRRALYGRVLLLWGWAFGSQHYIDIGIDVDGGEAQLRATQSDEPQWAAMRFCETHALNASVEGLPCASLLAEEIIVHGGRYELRTSAGATTAAALGVPRADTAVAPAPYSLPLRRSDDRATVVRDASTPEFDDMKDEIHSVG